MKIQKSMRILIPTDVFPPRCGGSGWSTYYLVRALQKRGHEITALVPKPNVSGISFGKYDGIDTIYIGYKKSAMPLVGNYYKNELFWKGFEKFLISHLSAENYDVIHAQHQITTVPSANAGVKCSIPVVATVRDYWPVCYFGTMFSRMLDDCGLGCKDSMKVLPFKMLAKAYMRNNIKSKQAALKKCARIICVSNFVKGVISEGVAAENIRVVPNIMEPVGGARKESDYILYVGSVSREKGIFLLLDALKRIKNAPRTVVIGSGYLTDSVRNRVRKEKLNVELLGRLSHEDVIKYMLSCRVFAFPSLWHEPLSRTLIEASVLGLPIVATNTGGTPDIIKDKKTGLLADTKPGGFARKLKLILKDKRLRLAISMDARKIAMKKFSEAAVASQVEGVYKEALLA